MSGAERKRVRWKDGEINQFESFADKKKRFASSPFEIASINIKSISNFIRLNGSLKAMTSPTAERNVSHTKARFQLKKLVSKFFATFCCVA